MSGEAWRGGSAGVSVLERVSSAGLLSRPTLCSTVLQTQVLHPEKPSSLFVRTLLPTEETRGSQLPTKTSKTKAVQNKHTNPINLT